MMSNATDNLAATSAAAGSGQFWALAALFLTIIIAGVVGGSAASIASWRHNKSDDTGVDASDVASKIGTASHFILLGVVAAACVPLFLSLTQSRLLVKILSNGDSVDALEGYLIFLGLCLVAAFSSRRFIDIVSQQIFQRIKEVDEKASVAHVAATEAKATATDAKETAQEIAEDVEAADAKTETENPSPSPPEVEWTLSAEVVSISPEERETLRAMSHRPTRTISGIVKDTGIARPRVLELLKSLALKDLATPTTSARTGGLRWKMTPRGRATLNSPN